MIKNLDAQKHIGYTLMYGVLLIAGLSIIGGMLYLYQHPPHTMQQVQAVFMPFNLKQLWHDVRVFDAAAIIQLSLLLLFGLQLLRVLMTGLIFMAARQWVFVLCGMVIFATLVFGLCF